MRLLMATRFSWLVFANASNASLYEKLNFNFIRDIAPIAGIARAPRSWWSFHPFRPKRFLSL